VSRAVATRPAARYCPGVVRVMTSRGHRWFQTVAAVTFIGVTLLNLVGAKRFSGGWFVALLFAIAAAGWTVRTVMAWTTPAVVFSSDGVKFPARRLVPWSEVATVNLGRPIPWPSTPEVVLVKGKRFTLPTADLNQLAEAEELIPDAVLVRPSRAP